jgi:hypothetical protein
MKPDTIKSLVLQSLEHERGEVSVYQTALTCVQNGQLREEWERYLEETRAHVRALTRFASEMGFDPEEEIPGRKIVRDLGMALVTAMEGVSSASTPAEAELVACECVMLAETKDHLDQELLGKIVAQ